MYSEDQSMFDDLFVPYNFNIFDDILDQGAYHQQRTNNQAPIASVEENEDLQDKIPQSVRDILAINFSQDQHQEPQQDPQNQVPMPQDIVEQYNLDEQSLNNLPKITISIIKKALKQIRMYQVMAQNIDNQILVQQCFDKIKALADKLKSKDGRLSQLRLFLNLVDQKSNLEFMHHPRLQHIKDQYFKILQTYKQDIMNQAKIQIQQALWNHMTPRWMSFAARRRQFSVNEQVKKRVLQKYLILLKQGLKNRRINEFVTRKDLLQCQLYKHL